MFDHLKRIPETKTDYESLRKRWMDIRNSPPYQRNPNENGHEYNERKARIAAWDEAVSSWEDSIDHQSLS